LSDVIIVKGATDYFAYILSTARDLYSDDDFGVDVDKQLNTFLQAS